MSLHQIVILFCLQNVTTADLRGKKARLLRHLAANNMLEETSSDVFKPTAFSQSLVQPVFGEWINYL